MKLRYIILLIFATATALVIFKLARKTEPFINPLATPQVKPKPLLAYTFEALRKTDFKKSPLTFGRVTGTATVTQQMFYFLVPDKPGGQPRLRVSGLMNAPARPGTYPVIIMLRGFIPEETYAPGAGTQHAAEVLARNGYITLAPDFLGFGESDKPSRDSFEARFQTYTTVLTLLSSLPELNSGLNASFSGSLQGDISHVGIWAHSNGGHIALSVLAITGAAYPTVLWAPVSKSFPYSILYYSDESDDQGKAMRKVLSEFEQDYDADLFSPPRYYSWIQAPLEIGQGTGDQEVPYWWSDDLVAELKKEKVEVTYRTYPGADHNMLPSGWSGAMTDSLSFFDSHLRE